MARTDRTIITGEDAASAWIVFIRKGSSLGRASRIAGAEDARHGHGGAGGSGSAEKTRWDAASSYFCLIAAW
jgi:hypothetical protein